MAQTFTFPTVSKALPVLTKNLLEYGEEVGSRNGRVMEFLNTQIVITDPQRREVLTLNRKANVFAQIAETMWVLSGRNDIEWLSAYLPRAKDYSDDGETWRGGYGPRIRSWTLFNGSRLDQLAHVVDLLRHDPLSRRAVIAIYDPGRDIPAGKDVPCNDFLQFQSRNGALHLTVTVRSNDVMWGWSGINAFEWSTLQEIVASLLGITVGTLTFNIGSLHLYDRHWDKASRLEFEEDHHAITPFNPGRNITTLEGVDRLVEQWFAWEEKCRAGDVSPSDREGWADPLIQSWAEAIAYYWTRDEEWLKHLSDTALGVAVARTPASVLPEPRTASRSTGAGQGHPLHLHERTRAFYGFVKDLHATKHRSYGDSWKKRGEKMSILANIARKVDRLGVGDEYDSSADTVIDLLVYLTKYLYWIHGRDDGPDNVNLMLGYALGETEEAAPEHNWHEGIRRDFDYYADNVDELDVATKGAFIRKMILRVAPIARDLWLAESGVGEKALHGVDEGDEYRGADID